MGEAVVFYSEYDDPVAWRRALAAELPDLEFRVAEGPGFGSAADAPQPARRPTPTPAAAGRGGAAPAPPAGFGGLQVNGLPIVKPPYGMLSAIAKKVRVV